MGGGNSADCVIKFDGRHFYLGDRGCRADTGEHHAGEIEAILAAAGAESCASAVIVWTAFVDRPAATAAVAVLLF
jgi:hypothetical protein